MKTYEQKEEDARVALWIQKLNVYLPGFINGDLESRKTKTADIVNHKEKIAVELKREKGGSLDNQDGNLVSLSNRLKSYFKKANRKFKFYPDYKTILIIELESFINVVPTILGGIPQLHFYEGNLVGSSIKNKNLYLEAENIGAIVFWPAPGSISGNTAYYFDTPFANKKCKLSQIEVENIIGNKLVFLEC